MKLYIDKKKLLNNFTRCKNWEEKYLYLIELGNYLSILPDSLRIQNYFISDCQSKVWVVITLNNNGKIYFFGDSDAIIVKGLIFVVFNFYQNFTLSEIINVNIKPFLDILAFSTNLTLSRSKGLDAIINAIRFQSLLLK